MTVFEPTSAAAILRVRDVDASVAWWRDRIGVEPFFVGRDGSHPIAALGVGTLVVSLWQLPSGKTRDRGENDHNTYLVWTVDEDAGSVRARLEERGVEVGPLQQSKNFEFFWFHDLDGNRFEISRAKELR